MATSGNFKTGSVEGRSLTFKWTLGSQNVANNRTTINWELVGSGSHTGWVNCGPFEVTIQGKVVYTSDTRVQVYPDTVVASGSTTINHNADGTKYFTASIEAAIYSYSVNVKGSGGWDLPQIPRNARITGATNFSNSTRDGLTIDYYNPAGSAIYALQACISFDGSAADVPYRDIPKSKNGSYTFDLTDAEMRTLMAGTTGGKRTVRVYVQSKVNSSADWSRSHLSRTFTVTEGGVSTGTVTANDLTYETDSDYSYFNGDSQYLPIIRGVGSYISIHVADIKYNAGSVLGDEDAEITRATCGDTTVTRASSDYGYISSVSNKTQQILFFAPLLSDSIKLTIKTFRGNYTKTIKIPADKWVNLTAPKVYGASRAYISAVGNINLTLRMSAWSGIVPQGDTTSIRPYYQITSENLPGYMRYTDFRVYYKRTNELVWHTTPETMIALEVGTDDSTYNFTGTIEDIVYTAAYDIKVELSTTDYNVFNGISPASVENLTTEFIINGISAQPVFDWGQYDFNFNVPVYMKNSLYLSNAQRIFSQSTNGLDLMMVSLNDNNQSFFGYGGYEQEIGTTYFDGNAVNIRSKNNINNTATGTIGGNKAWTNSSDARLKENIEDLPQVFCDIWLELQPKMFEWNEISGKDDKKHFGLIAQDVIDTFQKYGLDYKAYGFIETIPINEVDYFAITYEAYNLITAQVLKNTVNEVSELKKEIAEIKRMLS